MLFKSKRSFQNKKITYDIHTKGQMKRLGYCDYRWCEHLEGVWKEVKQ